MVKVIFDFDMFETKEATDMLTLSCIKHNYEEFVDEYGHDEANVRLARLFGTAWENCKERVWQWYDSECADEK